MTCHARRLERSGMCAAAVLCFLLLGGCSSPPSVLPLLEAAERAARLEAEHFEADLEREAHWLGQTQHALRRAYRRDFDEQAEMDVRWIMDATEAYAAAREELVRHEMRRREALARRRDNLEAIAAATQRASAILSQQDALLVGSVGGRVWDLLVAEGEMRR